MMQPRIKQWGRAMEETWYHDEFRARALISAGRTDLSYLKALKLMLRWKVLVEASLLIS
jgi:hypothetical protein